MLQKADVVITFRAVIDQYNESSCDSDIPNLYVFVPLGHVIHLILAQIFLHIYHVYLQTFYTTMNLDVDLIFLQKAGEDTMNAIQVEQILVVTLMGFVEIFQINVNADVASISPKWLKLVSYCKEFLFES